MKKNKSLFLIISRVFTVFIFTLTLYQKAYSESIFSGCTGINSDIGPNKDSDYLDPQMTVQAFFASQFNLSKNLMAHAEISISTSNIIENSIFNETPAEFRIDELSLIYRKQFDILSNYLSLFMGTYEPIGSDIFLQRQFGIQPISSKLMDNWLGLAGSIVYPLFGAGLSDIIHFNSQPIATGIYFYLNHENSDYFVLNSDARFACVYRLITFDFAAGLGAPLGTEYEGEDVILLINKLYAHSGINVLMGNNYTQSFFLQAGISNIPIVRNTEAFVIDPETVYLLIEPRIILKDCHINLTFFSLPEDTVKTLLFVTDTLGINLLIYNDSLYLKNKCITFGLNTMVSFPDKNFISLGDLSSIFDDGYTITIAPYYSTKLALGEFHTMLEIEPTVLTKSKYWASMFKFNIGYRTQL